MDVGLDQLFKWLRVKVRKEVKLRMIYQIAALPPTRYLSIEPVTPPSLNLLKLSFAFLNFRAYSFKRISP